MLAMKNIKIVTKIVILTPKFEINLMRNIEEINRIIKIASIS
jgi:hypothetical protein